jgi:hypothetical protein
MCCLMQEITLENKMRYYSHIIIIKNRINYATLCLLATWLIQDLLKIQQCPFKRFLENKLFTLLAFQRWL